MFCVVLYETDVGNIVDVVDWTIAEDISGSDNRLDVFRRWKKADVKATQCPWVLCGKPFDDRDPVQD